MSKQDRQGVRTASELERKYQFGKQFAEIMGIALDAQKNVTEVESTLSDKILNQYSSFTRTTDEIKMEVGQLRETTEDIQNTIAEESTSIRVSFDEILMTALAEYVTTSDYETFKKTLETEFSVWAGGIGGRVSSTEERIEEVNGELQKQISEITKYFTFDINGLTIGQVDNPNKVVIDNDDITILVGDKVVQTFKSDGTGLIPILKVTTMANIMGLQFTQDSTHINCDYTGEVI